MDLACALCCESPRTALGRGRAHTCDGHVADALLVHGGHQDHGLRRHHHSGWQRLEHTEDDHGVTGEPSTQGNRHTLVAGRGECLGYGAVPELWPTDTSEGNVVPGSKQVLSGPQG